jgi:hypothetical protein
MNTKRDEGIARALRRSIEDIRETPLSEAQLETEKRHYGQPQSVRYPDESTGLTSAEYDRGARKAIRTPWHEIVRNAYNRFFPKR